MSAFIDKNGGIEPACNYINWAYTESITLNDQFATDTGLSLEDSFNNCREIQRSMATQYFGLETDLKGISTNDLRWNLANRVATWISAEDIDAAKTVPADIA